MIVTNHVDLPDDSFMESIAERWRNGIAIAPQSWPPIGSGIVESSASIADTENAHEHFLTEALYDETHLVPQYVVSPWKSSVFSASHCLS